MAATVVRLKGIACRCHLGVPAQERARRQRIVLDLDLHPRAARGRRYADYFEVYRRAMRTAEGRPFRLVEELAEAVARAVLRATPALGKVRVAVHKWPAAMPGVEVLAEVEKGR